MTGRPPPAFRVEVPRRRQPGIDRPRINPD